jgi:DNA repair exonuclease SbcCD ATPase subunit
MMKKIVSIALAISLIGGTSAFVYADDTSAVNGVTTVNDDTVAEQEVNETAGILPDSPFYSLELKIEQLQIEITKSQEHLAALEAKFAAERVAEAVVMANAEEDELAVEATNESVKLLTSSAKHISKAIEAKNDAAILMESLNKSYSNSEQVLKMILEKAPDESKEAIQNALDQQDKTITAINDFYAAKSAFFEAKDQLKVAKMELKIARQGGGPEAIQIAEDKVKEAEALKDELEELKDAAELAKGEVENLPDQAEKRIEKGMKQIEKANAKMERLDDKAAKDALKSEEKRIRDNSKQLEKGKKEAEKSREQSKRVKEKDKE